MGACLYANALDKAPSALYLSWMHDPSTTMTVQWHSIDTDSISKVYYRKEGDSNWLEKEGVFNAIEGTDQIVHVVELDELEPDADYEFRLEGKEGEHLFRTLPKSLTRPVKFVVGGDVYVSLSTMRKMNKQIASCDPDFVVVGGDIAYTIGRRTVYKGKNWEFNRWRDFLQEWKSQMVTPEGRMIPIVVVLGNHDIKPTALKQKSEHYIFYEVFAMQEKGVPYRVLDAGDYLSLFLLDSGHSFHIGGQQADWLEKTLFCRENVSYKMAAYHIAGYPSVYPYRGGGAKKIRSQWSPLFERYHLNVAFEHHNHAYKRTFPLKDGKIDPEGVIYMGDGSWGVSPRKPKKLWYLSKAAQTNAVCLVTLNAEKSSVEALNLKGEVIDSVTTLPTRSLVTWNMDRLMEW